MTDGTISTIVSLVVGMLATSVAAAVVSNAWERERRRAADHEAVALRDAGLRAEHHLLEIQVGQLRAQIADLQRQRTDLVALVEAARAGRDPAAAAAEGALRRAHASACSSVLVMTTNDNQPAIAFYQHLGFRVVEVRADAVAASRAIKPSIPAIGVGGVPITDEVLLELRP